ncbi:hypothetical protein HID58_084402 [Brassica napus]|uniref:Uncharacterized protein n=1 Tax=Brassica napus TaxID=3708 RepID=A0ABQ7XJP3_BRANA|nr:hypothetical protein HID58_084402 [Brassica napus]
MLGFCNDINLFCQSLIHGFGDFQELTGYDLAFSKNHQELGVRLIAESALADRRFQSYVAIGYPSWCP